MINRQASIEIIERRLPQIARLYGVEPADLQLYPEYDGCQNLIFFYQSEGVDRVLRVSFRPDRPPEQILAELGFIRYLHENGVCVSPPLQSEAHRYMETVAADDYQFTAVSFARAPGRRLPDNGYRYRDGVPIDEYYVNWGRLLGRMHRLSQNYSPSSPIRRPELVERLVNDHIPNYLPPTYTKVRERFHALLAELSQLPRDKGAYGLIHADFNDGNFCVDYDTGDLTLFDFDDSAYCWFMYDLADAWRSGVGWTAAEANPDKRRDFMARYFNTLLSGYAQEHTLPEIWLERLPTFLKLIEMAAFLSERRDMAINGEGEELDDEMAYQKKCIEDDIPFLGFFDSVYSPDRPFQLA